MLVGTVPTSTLSSMEHLGGWMEHKIKLQSPFEADIEPFYGGKLVPKQWTKLFPMLS